MELERQSGTLHQYLHQMQSEIGQSRKTLHQVLSEFLELKSKNTELAEQLIDVEIESCESLTPERSVELKGLLERLEVLQKQALAGYSTPETHPWYGLSHADLPEEEFDALRRMLRFATIDLNKFWIEVQSVPAFLKTLKSASIQEIEGIFKWLETVPAWNEQVSHPRLIPELADPISRKNLLEFVRDLTSIRILRKHLEGKIRRVPKASSELVKIVGWLAFAEERAKEHGDKSWTQAELEAAIAEANRRLEQAQKIQRFFMDLSDAAGAPQPADAEEAKRVLLALDQAVQMPKKVRPWRQKQILDPAQKVRLQTWQDRARPVLENRKRLEAKFRLEACQSVDQLRDLAAVLNERKLFHTFGASYKQALKRYEELLQPREGKKKAPKESRFEMSESLLEWANFIEQARAFEKIPEGRTTFGAQFKGIETDFPGACDTNAWAKEIRSLLGGDDFGLALSGFLFQASSQELDRAIALAGDPECAEVRAWLLEEEFASGRPLVEILEERGQKQQGLADLLQGMDTAGVLDSIGVGELSELRLYAEEMSFLMQRMESNSAVRAALKNDYRGEETDTAPVEQALAYVKYIAQAPVFDELKAVFLTAHGIQRLNDTRSLVPRTSQALMAVHEHFRKLEAATGDQVRLLAGGRSIQEISVPYLLERIGLALKQPGLMKDWVTYLGCERDARAAGLSSVLGFFEQRALPYTRLSEAYELAFHASLLKRAVGQGALTEEQLRSGS